MERWLRHQTYKPLAECPDGFEHPIAGWREFGSTLYPNRNSLEFINGLYQELLPNFQSKQLHIGGDEPWELGKGRSAERVELEGKHRVYLDFMKQLFELTAQHGHTAQFWADIIMERPDLVPELPKEVTPVIWGYEADSPFAEQCRIVAAAGFQNQFYVAPGAGNWNSFSGRLDIAAANIQLAAQQGQIHGAKGLLLTAWGDNGHHQPWPTLYPPLVLAAVAAWGHEISDAALPACIDAIFYPNQPSGNGEALCKLGQIDSLLPQPLPPTSFLHAALFANNEELPKLLSITDKQQVQAVGTQLEKIRTTGLDPQIRLGIQLNQAALKRCLGIAPSPHEHAKLIREFKRLWLQQSRPGGLNDSLSRLK